MNNNNLTPENIVSTTIELTDKETVDKAKELLDKWGIGLENGIMMFLLQVIKDNKFPFVFDVKDPNDVTVGCWKILMEDIFEREGWNKNE